MKKYSFVLLAILIICLPFSASAKRKLVQDNVDTQDAEQSRTPYKEADDGITLRKMRRVGVGLQAAGALGLGGALLDLNFGPQWGVTAGYGGGSGFQSFELQAKYVLAGSWLMPYMTFGYARWSSIGKSGPIDKTNPPVLGDKLLSGDEKAAGEFAKNLLYPGFGLQFMQLNGDYAGTSVYAELVVLLDIGNTVAAPTGTFGISYYF